MLESSQSWVLYILETQRGTFYTGITNNLEQRWKAHLQGKGAKYTRANPPSRIVYTESLENRSEASRREAEVKALDREAKRALIASAPADLSF